MEVDAEYDTITHRMFMDKLARDIKESEEKVREEREAKILEFQNEDRELKRLANELEEKKNMIADLTKELKEIPLNDNQRSGKICIADKICDLYFAFL